MKIFDAAVIGLGTMGTFACREMARRGQSVLGLDQFAPPHDRGSHSGTTRVFRTAYAEHPDYVPLALRAGALWDEIGAEEGRHFLHRSGLLSLGEPDGNLLAGIRVSASVHQLAVESLSREEVQLRFPAFAVPRGWEAVFESTAGWIDVDASLTAGLSQAERAGAELHRHTGVKSWSHSGSFFEVETSQGVFAARRLIVTAGAWAGRILADLNLPLTVVRKLLVWVRPQRPENFTPERFPVFASAKEFFYGFPDFHGQGVKLAIHWSGSVVAADADAGQCEPRPEEIGPVLEAASILLPSLTGGASGFDHVVRTRTCLYTMTPDEHFVIDRHPRYPELIFAAGFSGHGFKFATAIGEALADLALEGRARLPIDFLGLKRFSL